MSGELRAALRRARHWVESHGDALSRARIHVLLGAASSDAVVHALGSRQAPDGSFPVLGKHDAGRPGLAGTLQVLTVLGDLRRLDGAEVEDAVSWLESRQAPDGSWSVASDDPEPSRLVLTGLLGGHLARTDYARARVLDAAADFLAERWAPARVEQGDFGSLVAFLHFFSVTPHDVTDAALQWCGRALEKGFRSGRLDALRVARVFTLCDAHALPGARVEAREVVPALLKDQRQDGSWSYARGLPVDLRAEATLEAVLALMRLGGGEDAVR